MPTILASIFHALRYGANIGSLKQTKSDMLEFLMAKKNVFLIQTFIFHALRYFIFFNFQTNSENIFFLFSLTNQENFRIYPDNVFLNRHLEQIGVRAEAYTASPSKIIVNWIIWTTIILGALLFAKFQQNIFKKK